MNKREARERAMTALYQMDLTEVDPLRALLDRFAEDGLAPAAMSQRLVEGVMENLKTIDEKIQKYSKDWDLKRFSNIDRNILRIAIYEILFSEKTPYKVSVNEAVELSKTYSSEDAYKFINGILAQVIKELDLNN